VLHGGREFLVHLLELLGRISTKATVLTDQTPLSSPNHFQIHITHERESCLKLQANESKNRGLHQGLRGSSGER
jgi:hypothetical protein